MMNSLRLSAVVGLAVITVSCGNNNGFDAKSILEAAPVSLQGEQLTLSMSDVECGAQADLWESPSQVSQERSTARLSSKGRALNFSDDVTMELNSRPYIQVSGAFPLQVIEVKEIAEGSENNTKLVTARVGVKIQHACFQNPLPVMGVKRGNFQHDTAASFLLRLTKETWKVEKIVH
jgi:hypothetical protein